MNEFDHLEDLDKFRASTPAKVEKKPTFPCMSCAGTGRYQGVRRHQMENICFACNGRGHHTKPHAQAMADKAQAKAKREQGRADAITDRRERFEATYPGLRAWMVQQQWSSFVTEMVEKIDSPYGLSDRQVLAVQATREKQMARRVEKQAARTSDVDLSQIEAMFDKARQNGLKKLVYRAHGLQITPAPAHGKNPGAIYVKEYRGDYLGKVLGGKLFAAAACTPEHKATLNKVAANPAEEARAYGKETGTCCCCGRELTDPVSIEMGIGPICADNWGF